MPQPRPDLPVTLPVKDALVENLANLPRQFLVGESFRTTLGRDLLQRFVTKNPQKRTRRERRDTAPHPADIARRLVNLLWSSFLSRWNARAKARPVLRRTVDNPRRCVLPQSHE